MPEKVPFRAKARVIGTTYGYVVTLTIRERL